MQIAHIEIVPVELELALPHRAIYHEEEIEHITAVFVRVDTRGGLSAWGCAAFDPAITGETVTEVLNACRRCADRIRDENPLNTEYTLSELTQLTAGTPSALCAFDLAIHDLLGLATGQPLHRLLGGYRNRIQTSVTIGVMAVQETVEQARDRARQGFRILKLKGGRDPEEDIHRVRAVHDALPDLTVRLDADQGYTIQQALDVAQALEGRLEMLEQPTPAEDLEALQQVTRHSPVPILADESVRGPKSALKIASQHSADGVSVKLSTCGGLHCARQVDAIARAAHLATMVSCVTEPALLTAAGLSFALSSPNVQYGDLDGHLDLIDDPTVPGFRLEDGWLIARDVPGLGCVVEL